MAHSFLLVKAENYEIKSSRLNTFVLCYLKEISRVDITNNAIKGIEATEH